MALEATICSKPVTHSSNRGEARLRQGLQHTCKAHKDLVHFIPSEFELIYSILLLKVSLRSTPDSMVLRNTAPGVDSESHIAPISTPSTV